MTPKQHELYAFIAQWSAEKGYPPSYEEMARGVGLKSKGNVSRLVDLLQRDGLVRRNDKQKRGVVLVKPDAVKLHPEVMKLTDDYARELGVSRETAANDLIRTAIASLHTAR